MAFDQIDKTVASTIMNLVTDSIVNPEKKGGTMQYHISEIEESVLDYYVDSIVGEDHVVSLGIHTIVLIDQIVSSDRIRLEYTAMCHLLITSRKYEKVYKDLTREQQLNSPESIIAVINRRSYRMFQAFMLGYMQFADSPIHREIIKKYEQEIVQTCENGAPLDLREIRHNILDKYKEERKHFYHLVVLVKTIGTIKWPSTQDFDMMFERSRFTRDVFKAYDLIMIRKNKRIVSIWSENHTMMTKEHPFYIQLTDDWQ